MPITKKRFTPEQLAARARLIEQARIAGAIPAHQKMDYGPDARFEPICLSADGVVMTHTGAYMQPTTPEEWVVSARKRGLIPVA